MTPNLFSIGKEGPHVTTFDTPFETIADALAGPPGLATGLPQLDRVAPLHPGRLAVLMGASGTGKTRVADHIASTLNCTRETGALVIREPMTVDALASALAFRSPAMLVVDPIMSLVDEPAPVTDPDRLADQHAVRPAHLGQIGARLRALAERFGIPVLACHRYTPIRDSCTGQIISTDAINPLIAVADVVAFARVQADPRQLGLEIIRNQLGPIRFLRVPLAALS